MSRRRVEHSRCTTRANPTALAERARRELRASLRSKADSERMMCMDKTLTRWQRVFVLVGSIGPLGHLPASGSATVAVVGIPLFYATHSWPSYVYVLATLAFTLASVGVHQVGDRILGEKDSRKLVWDEIVGFMFAVAFVPFSWPIALVAFVVQRTLDITKFPPARWIENHWPGGWGVVGDDVVAGLYTCALMHVLIRVAPGVFGLTP